MNWSFRRSPEGRRRAKVAWALSAGALLGALFAPISALAEPPDLQTPAPVIYLTDNLDEQDSLGYCIDTVGRGFGERLHAHSCKPRGGDVQFAYDSASRRIESATFSGKCAELAGPAAVGTALGLVDCSEDSVNQAFEYDGNAMAFHPVGDKTLCLAVGEASRSAGPFMSRDLALAPCTSIDAKFWQWRVQNELK